MRMWPWAYCNGNWKIDASSFTVCWFTQNRGHQDFKFFSYVHSKTSRRSKVSNLLKALVKPNSNPKSVPPHPSQKIKAPHAHTGIMTPSKLRQVSSRCSASKIFKINSSHTLRSRDKNNRNHFLQDYACRPIPLSD